MKDILSGLNVMHEKNFVHRDLKPENILINTENTSLGGKQSLVAKIADFGLSAEYKINLFSSENMDEKMGTILYMAPEQALGQRYGKRVDLWACGVIMYKILTGIHPFYKPTDTEKDYILKITSHDLSTSTPFSELA